MLLFRCEVIHRDGIFKQRIIPGHDRDAALGYEIALAVRIGIEANGGALRDVHVTVKDRASDMAVASYADMRKKDAGIHFRIRINADVRR